MPEIQERRDLESTDMPTSLEHVPSEIVDAAIAKLRGRATSIHARLDESATRRHATLALEALVADLASNRFDAVRGAVQTIIEELAARHLSFTDVRFFVLTLRSLVREAIVGAAEDLRPRVDEWFFEMLMVATMRFVTERDAAIQEQSAKLAVRQLESQLKELQAALEDKTRLLEMIRQASTPIVPLVEGILVVPLIGTFDAVRAQNLTEKLLHEVARLRARAAILDITGVPMFDTAAAQLIIRLARAVQLLGAEVSLVGMSPDNAQTIVALGVDLSGLRMLGTLQDGLTRALLLRRLRIAPV
jgi:anti-anti-sigma factor